MRHQDGLVDLSRVGRQRKTRRDRQVSGSLWPNGEFSLGWVKEDSEELGEEYLKAPPGDISHAGRMPAIAEEYDRLQSALRVRSALRSIVGAMVLDVAGPLGLSLVRNLHVRPRRPETYGRRGITGYGKKMVRNAAHILQREHGPKCLSFLTLTVPPLEPEKLRAIAQNWGAMVNRLYQWIGRRLKSAGLPIEVVGCTELQPKRLNGSPLGSLHLHVVFVGKQHRYRREWAVSYLGIRSWWLKELSRRTGVNVTSEAVENLQCVHSNASAYLGKYMSKGADGAEAMAKEGGWECVPRQWWNITKSLRDRVLSEKRKGHRTGLVLEAIISQYFAESGPFPGVLFAHHIQLDGGEFLCGYSGRLTRLEAENLTHMIKSG
jgi:hypothetical protein